MRHAAGISTPQRAAALLHNELNLFYELVQNPNLQDIPVRYPTRLSGMFKSVFHKVKKLVNSNACMHNLLLTFAPFHATLILQVNCLSGPANINLNRHAISRFLQRHNLQWKTLHKHL